MISNLNWQTNEGLPCYHQISMDCIGKLAECMEKLNKGEIDIETSFGLEKQILTKEIGNPEFLAFALENYSELASYIASGRISIRIHKDTGGKIWFGVG